MIRATRFAFAALATFAGLAGLALGAVGCSLQAEGERCSVANGSADCESPLVCTKRELLTGSTVDRCCPADRAQATTAECAVTFSGASDAGSSPTTPLVDAGTAATDSGARADGASTADASSSATDAAPAADAQ
jgi:hypothetical protein